MKIKYADKNFRQKSLNLLSQVNNVIDEYSSKGYDLTLRQIYYQLVAGDIIPNNERSYKNLGTLISDGRMCGLVDWNAIIDRTRMLRELTHWSSASQIISATAEQFKYDTWEGQDNYVEVWVEKDALLGIVERICNRLDIPYFSCRGYVSQSEMWNASERLKEMEEYAEKQTVILHLGDHDPSGKDMSRDIQDRLELFGVKPQFKRIALNMNQVEEFMPPPNPTKVSDSRAGAYIKKYGYECWELDALKPETLDELITSHVHNYCDLSLLKKKVKEQEKVKKVLKKISDNWNEVVTKFG